MAAVAYIHFKSLSKYRKMDFDKRLRLVYGPFYRLRKEKFKFHLFHALIKNFVSALFLMIPFQVRCNLFSISYIA